VGVDAGDQITRITLWKQEVGCGLCMYLIMILVWFSWVIC